MKHVNESLRQYYDYKFFKVLEEKEEKEEKTNLKDKEQEGLSVIEKITKNFEDFKKDADGDILRYKEFWEENLSNKKAFTEPGDVFKMFDSNYVVGVLELPAETLSDGSLDGGLGATGEPTEEIIEGPELEPAESEEPATDFFEEQMVPNPTNEAAEGEDDLNLDLGVETAPTETPEESAPEPDATVNIPEIPDAPGTEAPPAEEMPPVEEPAPTEDTSMTGPQKYFVVYDMSGGEREEIFRTGSNNVVNGFTSFYNDTFKGAMKSIIAQYKTQKEQQKVEAEKSEKQHVETEKESKIQKFLKG